MEFGQRMCGECGCGCEKYGSGNEICFSDLAQSVQRADDGRSSSQPLRGV